MICSPQGRILTTTKEIFSALPVYYHRRNQNEQDVVTILSNDRQFSGDFTILPSVLKTKRHYNVRTKDLELTLKESAAKSGEEKDLTIFLGQIKGTVPIREMLQKSGESDSLHPARSLNPPKGMMGDLLKGSRDHTYVELFQLKEGKRCNHWNCGICHASDEQKIISALAVNPNDELGSYLIRNYMIGSSIYDKAALKNYFEKSLEYLSKRITEYRKAQKHIHFLEMDTKEQGMRMLDEINEVLDAGLDSTLARVHAETFEKREELFQLYKQSKLELEELKLKTMKGLQPLLVHWNKLQQYQQQQQQLC